ncbi:hypothetical protein N8275_11715 [Pseudomonadales bacterium]|jgi:hypothetical protein|nr:hypothetical protein [Pseudomonadales bacterium]
MFIKIKTLRKRGDFLKAIKKAGLVAAAIWFLVLFFFSSITGNPAQAEFFFSVGAATIASVVAFFVSYGKFKS